MKACVMLSLLLLSGLPHCACCQEWDAIRQQQANRNLHKIYIDGKKTGRAFEGFGSLSAGASSRLLYDYPEPYRSDILDYLFKPGFGANIHHLKVEIGGDINSTDGSEPSIAATREEFEHAQPGYFRRGYEFWLMAEAKKRNPAVILEGLQWGAPGWIGNGSIYSQDNADFVCAWIKGAATYWGLTIQYLGGWNERNYDIPYFKLLRQTLDRHGLQHVRIDAGDLWRFHEKWMIADDLLRDSALMQAVGVINSHTTEEMNYYVTEQVKQTGKPVWAGESHFYGGDWYAAASWARAYRSYITGGITKVINWSLVNAYHDWMVVPRSGLMKANTPWSGHYEVQPSIWALAHINQFAAPGWKYLNTGCKWWASEGSLQEGLSMITLKSPDTDDYSIIIETMDAREPQVLQVKLSTDLSSKDLILFRSQFNKEEFIRDTNIRVQDRQFTITVFPNAIYSLTTSGTPSKGKAAHPIPAPSPVPADYENDFEEQELHTPARYFSDQHGSFEVVQRPDGKGKCLQQIALTSGICWRCDWKHPQTVAPMIDASNYRFSASLLLPDTGTVVLWGRTNRYASYSKTPFTGYGLRFHANGNWELILESGKELASGPIKKFAGKWHQAELLFRDDMIGISIDGKKVSTIKDATYTKGAPALGTGWNKAFFDDIRISAYK